MNKLLNYLASDKVFLIVATIAVPCFSVLGFMLMKGIYQVYGQSALLPFFLFVLFYFYIKLDDN